MISRPSPDLPQHLARARKRFRLSLAEFAAELHIRPEWLSKIVNGHVQPSYNIGLRLESFLRRNGLDTAAIAKVESEGEAARSAAVEAERLCSDILALCRALADSAKNDVTRLELIFDRLREISTHVPQGLKPRPKSVEKKPLAHRELFTPVSIGAQSTPKVKSSIRPYRRPQKRAVISDTAGAKDPALQDLRRKLLEYRRRSSGK